MFERSTIVRLRNDPAKAGEIASEPRLLGDRVYYKVRMGDGSGIKQFPEDQLEAITDSPDALDDLRYGKVSAPDDLRRLLTHIRLTGKLADLIYSMEATNTEFHAYQFKPVVKLLNSAARGLLIADEVGLGKTIEAGLVWTELVARFDFSRLLVVCPKSLVGKWKLELRNKFAVSAKITDAAGLLQELKDDRDMAQGFALICSLSALRPPRGWADAPPKSGSAALAQFLEDKAADDALFDLAIVDEAHHLRNPETSQHALGRLVLDVSDYRLLLSATPINLRSEDLRSLLKILDPETFSDEFAFAVMEMENAPIVAAREKVLDPAIPLREVLNEVAAIPAGTILRTDERMRVLSERLRGDIVDSPALRVEIAAHLEDMSLLGSVVNRTRRRDVNELKVIRRAHTLRWEMSDVEKGFYEAATRVVQEHASSIPANDRFLLATPQRLIASSLPAAYEHWSRNATDFSMDDPDVAQPAPGPLVSKLAELCQRLGQMAELEGGDTKYELLRTSLKREWGERPHEKLIVFSSFRRTIDYLARRLTADGIAVEKMHGSIKEDREAILTRFAATKQPVVLLTSEVGGEGLDLQFCRTMINYDLPWNPMKVEQRIGRVDRIGQQSETIDILSMVCEGTIEAQVYDRLYDRIRLIERTLGSFETILGKELASLERRLMDPGLTDAERGREIDRARIAVENKHKQEEELEEEAAGLIAHGDMILRRIHENHRPDRRIGGDELVDYVRVAIEGRYEGARLQKMAGEDSLYEIKLTPRAHFDFIRFLDSSARRYQTWLQAKLLSFARLVNFIVDASEELFELANRSRQYSQLFGISRGSPQRNHRLLPVLAPCSVPFELRQLRSKSVQMTSFFFTSECRKAAIEIFLNQDSLNDRSALGTLLGAKRAMGAMLQCPAAKLLCNVAFENDRAFQINRCESETIGPDAPPCRPSLNGTTVVSNSNS